MRLPVDERFLREARDFRLVSTCEHCVYFDVEHAACSEGYPNAEHLVPVERVGQRVCFCKKFELL